MIWRNLLIKEYRRAHNNRNSCNSSCSSNRLVDVIFILVVIVIVVLMRRAAAWAWLPFAQQRGAVFPFNLVSFNLQNFPRFINDQHAHAHSYTRTLTPINIHKSRVSVLINLICPVFLPAFPPAARPHRTTAVILHDSIADNGKWK